MKRFVNRLKLIGIENTHLKSVCFTLSGLTTFDQDYYNRGGGEGVGEDEGVEVDSDFANVAARLADCVGARIRVGAEGAGEELLLN